MYGAAMSQTVIRLAVLETPKVDNEGGEVWGLKILIFILLLKKIFLIALKFRSLVVDGVYSVISIFQEFLRKTIIIAF